MKVSLRNRADFRNLGVLVLGFLVSSCAGPRISQDIDEVLSHYQGQASMLNEQMTKKSWAAADLPQVPESFNPWWHISQHDKLLGGTKQEATLEDLYIEALANSSQIRVFSELPLIRRTGIQEAKGEFDTVGFVEMKYENKSDPVGSTLTTGTNSNRFQEETYPFRTGLRKKIITGGEFEVTQEISRTGNNSRFLTPNPQADAQLTVRYTQPFLQGAGIKYNESIVKVAELDSEIAVSEFLRQTESHLVEISRSYWGLYMARVILMQKKKLVKEAGEIIEELESRSDFDAKSTQLARARAALSERRAVVVRSELAVRNAQDRIKALVNTPFLIEANRGELVPKDAPFIGPVNVDLMEAAQTALEHRPEISQAFTQLKAAAIREDMSRNEVLPKLNIFVESYLAGLAGRGRWADAVGNQYSEGGPGYSIGVYGEFPFENNVGRARLERRKLESRQQLSSVRTTIETVLLELKVSVREVKTALRDMQAKYESMLASNEELESLTDRRDLDTGDEMTTSAYLTFLLDSQDRSAIAQEEFVRSMVTYNVSIVNLERAKGTLLGYENISYNETVDPETDLPVLNLVKDGPSQTTTAAKLASKPAPQSIDFIDPDELESELMEEEPPVLEYDISTPEEPIYREEPQETKPEESIVPDESSASAESFESVDVVQMEQVSEVETEVILPEIPVQAVSQPESISVNEEEISASYRKDKQVVVKDTTKPSNMMWAFAGLLLITGVAFGIRQIKP